MIVSVRIPAGNSTGGFRTSREERADRGNEAGIWREAAASQRQYGGEEEGEEMPQINSAGWLPGQIPVVRPSGTWVETGTASTLTQSFYLGRRG